MSLQGWQTLKCHKCDGERFVAVYNLQYQGGLGTSSRPAGYHCLGCNEKVDQEKSVLVAKRKEAELKIKDIEASING